MSKNKIVYILSISESCGADLIKEEFDVTDEAFDVDEFDTFEEYVEYCVDEIKSEIEQRHGNAISLNEGELDFIVEKINELRSQ